MPKILKLILYADDTTIYFSSPNLQSLFSTFNSELVYINEWFLKNKLTVNLTKTNYVLFHSSRRSATTSNLILNLGNHPIEEKCSVRFLGVYFDECLTWNRHIEYLSRKLCKYPFLFYTSRPYLSLKYRKILYNTLVNPNILYCITAWGNASRQTLKPLQLLQKKIIRSISEVNAFHPSDPLFKNLNILKIEKLHLYMSTIYVFRSLNCLNRCDWFHAHHHAFHNLRSNNLQLLNVPFNRNTQYCKSIRINGPKLWNDLPLEIRLEDSYNVFKLRSKLHLLEFHS